MKCVIVALALLCSAQALKMDRAPRSARAHRTLEAFDAVDRKRGRPERSKAGLKKVEEEYTGTDKSVGDDVTSALYTWGDSNGFAGFLGSCSSMHTDSVDIMLCVGDGLVGSTGADLSGLLCAETDAWNTDSEDIVHTVLDGCLEASKDAAEDLMGDVMKGMSADQKRRAAFNWQAETDGAAHEYLDGHGTYSFVQNIIDGYSFYCDEISASAMADLLSENGLGDKETASSRQALLEMTEANLAADTVMAGGKSFGEWFKDKWNAHVDAAKALSPALEKQIIRDQRSRHQQTVNHQKWRKGQFRRLGRTPQ
jgi:hypothetical protein